MAVAQRNTGQKRQRRQILVEIGARLASASNQFGRLRTGTETDSQRAFAAQVVSCAREGAQVIEEIKKRYRYQCESVLDVQIIQQVELVEHGKRHGPQGRRAIGAGSYPGTATVR